MSYEEAITAHVTLRNAMRELTAHGFDPCEFATDADTHDIIFKETGEIVAYHGREGYSGGDVLGWLGY